MGTGPDLFPDVDIVLLIRSYLEQIASIPALQAIASWTVVIVIGLGVVGAIVGVLWPNIKLPDDWRE